MNKLSNKKLKKIYNQYNNNKLNDALNDGKCLLKIKSLKL